LYKPEMNSPDTRTNRISPHFGAPSAMQLSRDAAQLFRPRGGLRFNARERILRRFLHRRVRISRSRFQRGLSRDCGGTDSTEPSCCEHPNLRRRMR
jgi:hypothetical protein